MSGVSPLQFFFNIVFNNSINESLNIVWMKILKCYSVEV